MNLLKRYTNFFLLLFFKKKIIFKFKCLFTKVLCDFFYISPSRINIEKHITHYFGKKYRGVFFEVGGADGIQWSNTYYLENKLGWSGYLVEANKYLFNMMKNNRPRCVNINALLSDKVDNKIFYNVGLSSFVSDSNSKNKKNDEIFFFNQFSYSENIEKLNLLSNTFKNLTIFYNIKKIDLLIIDVEDHEIQLIKGIDFNFTRIKILVIETKNIIEVQNLLNNYFKLDKKLIENNYIFKNIIF